MTLYQNLVAARCDVDNHESGLYVKANTTSREIIKQALARGEIRTRPTMFINQAPPHVGEVWLNVPLARR